MGKLRRLDPFMTKLLAVLLASLVVSALICVGGVYGVRRYLMRSALSFYEGPFGGKPASVMPAGKPRSTIDLSSTMKLESWDAPTTSTSAIMQLTHSRKGVLWTIEAEGWQPADTRRVTFSEVTSRWSGYTVSGYADWSAGYERAVWNIDNDGDLDCYYYSW